jgi:hypothetical protein
MTDPASSEGTPATSSDPRRRRWLALVIVLALLIGVGGTVFVLSAIGAFSTEIRAEPIQIPGENPFTPPMSQDQPNVTPPPNTGRTFSGGTSGLYGGTLNNSSCNRDAMVAFLQANPDKAAAWASVQGIAAADIPAYIAGLTPLILRSDTAVTNHGYSNGEATTVHSVLQAGTAVLADKFGVPRARCYCGNPLTPPQTFSKPRYVGTAWPAFSQTNITTVQPATYAINEFIIVDPITNAIIYRPAGTAGERDRGELRDAAIAGSYTLNRTMIKCSGFEKSCMELPRPMNIRIDCDGNQCAASWIGGGWSTSHPLTREGDTYRTSGEDDTASECNGSPRPTMITFEVTVTSAEIINGVWRAKSLQGRYLVSASAAPGCNAGEVESALSS